MSKVILHEPAKYAATLVKYFEGDKAMATAQFINAVAEGEFPGVKPSGTYALQVVNAIWGNTGD